MIGKLARSSLVTIGVLGLRMLTQAATLVLITRLLGPSLYGDYMAAASLAVVAGLIPNLGSGYVLMARTASEGHSAVETWRYGWPLSISIGAFLCLGFPFVAQLLTRGTLSFGDLLLIGFAELLVTPITQLLGFVLQARDRVPQGQFLLWLPLCFRAIAAATCLTLVEDGSLHLFVALQAAGATAGLATALIMTLRVVRLPWAPRRPTRQEWRSGAAYAAMHVVAANPGELDKMTSPLLLGDHAAGIYSASSRVMNAVVTPVLGILLASQPRLFRHGSAPTSDGQRLIRTLGYLAFAWGVISALGMAVIAPALPFILGQAFSDTALTLPWMALAAPFVSLRMAAGTILVALGKPLQRLRFELTGIVVLGCLLTIGAHVLGLRGMALGLACSEACMATYGYILVRAART